MKIVLDTNVLISGIFWGGYPHQILNALKTGRVSLVISRDPDDDKFIACALAGHARHIVSGDRDLLVIGSYHGVRILKPREFVVQHLS